MTADGTRARPIQRWSVPPPPVDVGRLLRVQGYRDLAKVRPAIRKAAERMAAAATGAASPEACYRRVSIERLSGGRLELEDGIAFQCPAFDRLLADAREVAVFVLTLGATFDAEVAAHLAREELLEALLLESAGWLTIERLTRQLGIHLRGELAPQGFALGYRMGPGYSYRPLERQAVDRINWPLEQQGELFRVLAAAPLPVALNDSFAMRPKMSRSGLFGLVPVR